MARLTPVFLAFLCYLELLYAKTINLNSLFVDGGYEFIDLSHPFDNTTVYWPGNKNFRFTKKTEEFQGDDHLWYAANEFAAAEHGGTHLDAPYHFFLMGKHVGDIPLERLIVSLIVVDISGLVNDNPDFVLYKHHLDYMLDNAMGNPCVIIFKFGWSKHYGTKKYLGMDEEKQTLSFPGPSAELAEWITVSYKNVVGMGVDTASLDPGSSTDFPVHRILAKAGLYNMENVNLHQPLPSYGCTALVMPMKILEGTGAPLRLVAICPKKIPTEE